MSAPDIGTLPAPGTTFTVMERGVPILVLIETAPGPGGWVDYTWSGPSGCTHKAMAPAAEVASWYADALTHPDEAAALRAVIPEAPHA